LRLARVCAGHRSQPAGRGGKGRTEWLAGAGQRLAPTIAHLIFDRIAALHQEDRATLLLVEQRVAEALESCDYGYVLETGRVVLEGPHRALVADDRVRRAYLGM
jgi:ABC-type branched-subunit amino acid transport system ATPase component